MGGKTVAEAKTNMEYSEYCDWVTYRKKFGNLNGFMRLDVTLGMIAAHFSSAFVKYSDGSKAKPEHFSIFPVDFGEEKAASPEDVFRYLSGFVKKD